MTPEETVDEFIRRVVAVDLDGAAELVSDDLEYDNVPIGKVSGPDGLKSFLSAMVSGIDEVVFVIHRQTVAGNTVMNERTDRFRLGENWIDLPVAGVFEVGDDGKIVLWRDYFDAATFYSQLETVTATGPPDRIEGRRGTRRPRRFPVTTEPVAESAPRDPDRATSRRGGAGWLGSWPWSIRRPSARPRLSTAGRSDG